MIIIFKVYSDFLRALSEFDDEGIYYVAFHQDMTVHVISRNN